jgi:cohesin loading factor subunit SCC2
MLRQRPTQSSKVVLVFDDCLSLTGKKAARPAPTPVWQMLEKLPLLRTSVLIALIMLLKAHLKNLYGLTEECGVLSCSRFLDGFSDREYRKCLKWVIGKKNALGDKPATRRAGAAAAPLTWARLPFATQPLLTTADMAAQRDMVCHVICDHSPLPIHHQLHQFLEIWHEDGVTAEPEDDFT